MRSTRGFANALGVLCHGAYATLARYARARRSSPPGGRGGADAGAGAGAGAEEASLGAFASDASGAANARPCIAVANSNSVASSGKATHATLGTTARAFTLPRA